MLSMTEPPFHHDDMPGTAFIGTPATTTIHVPSGQDRVVITLSGRDEFAVSLLPADLSQLLTALLEGEISYVASTHAVHGRILLNVRPTSDGVHQSVAGWTESGARVLSLAVPGLGTCTVVFDALEALGLVVQLEAAWRLINEGPAD